MYCVHIPWSIKKTGSNGIIFWAGDTFYCLIFKEVQHFKGWL